MYPRKQANPSKNLGVCDEEGKPGGCICTTHKLVNKFGKEGCYNTVA